MAFEDLQHAAAFEIPDCESLIPGAGERARRPSGGHRRGQDRANVAFEGTQDPAALKIPDLEGAVFGAGEGASPGRPAATATPLRVEAGEKPAPLAQHPRSVAK